MSPSARPTQPDRGDPAPDAAFVDELPAIAARLKKQVARVIVGQDEVVEEILITLLAGGHAILEGVPGLAKTLLVNTVAAALSLDFGRIQFTPDLMPSDITGTLVVREDRRSGARDFVFRRGPIFVNTVLADEINRSPPKTQAALLEGMAEGNVTVAGTRHPLPRPFFVLATQNPIEQEGTYQLPEAELDRFLLKIHVDYPDFGEEWSVIERTTGAAEQRVSEALSRTDVLSLQKVVRSLTAPPNVVEYAARLVRRTRPEETDAPGWVREHIAWGAGPRGAQALVMAAKARTLLEGRYAVTPSDVAAAALPVLRHRIVPSFQAGAENLATDDLVLRLVEEIPVYSTRTDYDAITKSILRL